jgi:hypothetical protein
MGMTDQLLDLSSQEGTVLDRLGDAEETIRQVLKDADEMLRLHLVYDGTLPCGRSARRIVYDLTDIVLLALAAARYRRMKL